MNTSIPTQGQWAWVGDRTTLEVIPADSALVSKPISKAESDYFDHEAFVREEREYLACQLHLADLWRIYPRGPRW